MDLYEACYDDKWLQWAEQLQETQNKLFWDEEAGGYFSSGLHDRTIVLRMKDGTSRYFVLSYLILDRVCCCLYCSVGCSVPDSWLSGRR